jgi:hypothetical protein
MSQRHLVPAIQIGDSVNLAGSGPFVLVAMEWDGTGRYGYWLAKFVEERRYEQARVDAHRAAVLRELGL